MVRLVHQSLHGDLTSTKNPLISLLFERYPTSTQVGNKLLTKLDIISLGSKSPFRYKGLKMCTTYSNSSPLTQDTYTKVGDASRTGD